ncbi:bZIP transcription factor 17 [Cornus florida]|uniref:bZIP transcription factor 17 n=1 Tax=Cornus florida TaxID=4283 RepID=UPI00289F89E8|nr:bZIP transcription factor 17 [Cornus florida]
MADPPLVAGTISPNHTTTSDFNALPIPPLDPTIFSEDLILPDDHFLQDFDIDYDLDFTFDDHLYQDFLTTLPSSVEPSASPDISTLPSDAFPRVSNNQSATLNPGHPVSADPTFNLSNSPSSGFSQDHCSDVSRFLNVPSPESGGFNLESSHESDNKCLNAAAAARVLDYPSPDSEIRNDQISGPASSQGSGNCGSAVLDTHNYPSPDSGNSSRSLPSSLDCANNSLDGDGAEDQKIKLEELGNNFLLKRKKENEDVNSVPRTSKYRRSNGVDNANPPPLCGFDDTTNEEEEKKKARLMRNRESAQLSRQRKKHYVEELEDKVRTMHSTIQDLNSKISYIMAENASLRQQLSGGAMCPPPTVPHPGMYPHPPPMGYPWMPCPPYVVKSQGSQVPLVPIPRLKPQQPAQAPKARKAETKRTTEGKTKKVASVSFLGLLFFIMLFGGLVPMVNVKYGGMRDDVTGERNHIGNKFNDQHPGRVLTVNAHLNGTDQNIGIGLSNGKFGAGKDLTNTIHRGGSHIGGAESNIEPKGRGSHPLSGSDEFGHMHNASEPLIASLYVPRNDKLVKIDGNLIIHSVLASEKAMASRETPETKSRETGLAVPRNLSPAIPLSGRNSGRHPRLYRNPTERQRAIASGAAEKDNLKSKSADGKLQQWFREGLAGPMLRSGMCTEVFQFDVSPASAPGAIIPATSVRNISMDLHRNSTQLNKGRNRRILHGLPIPLPGSVNITKEHVGRNSEKDNFQGNDSLSSMVVSVLVDPREAGDSDGDGMMGPKSLSRIFVVVLLDSVKYVTYSCMLPLKGTGPHLVTT